MTEGPLQLRILRYTLLGPIDDARHILRRLQNNEAFQHYLRRRTLRALPLVVGILLTSLACSAAVVFLFFRAGILLVLAATIVVAPIVLIASFSSLSRRLPGRHGRGRSSCPRRARCHFFGKSLRGSCVARGGFPRGAFG